MRRTHEPTRRALRPIREHFQMRQNMSEHLQAGQTHRTYPPVARRRWGSVVVVVIDAGQPLSSSMVGIAILDDTEGEGHPMLGIVAINREHEEGWRACVGVQEKQKTKTYLWSGGRGHAGMRMGCACVRRGLV